MRLWLFNAALAGGLGAVAAGVVIEFGAGWGAIAGGALLLLLTLYVARVAGVH